MSEIIGIQAAALRYQAGDAPRLLADLAGWCDASTLTPEATMTRRSEWSAARLAAKKLVFQVNASWCLDDERERGIPSLIDGKSKKPVSTSVSWSHSDGWAVAVVAESAVGVDTERLDRPMERVLERVTSTKERARFGETVSIDGEAVPVGVALWCAKEAAAKATGLGMRFGLGAFEFEPELDGTWKAHLPASSPRRLIDPVVGFDRRDAFLVAVCTERAVWNAGLSWAWLESPGRVIEGSHE